MVGPLKDFFLYNLMYTYGNLYIKKDKKQNNKQLHKNDVTF